MWLLSRARARDAYIFTCVNLFWKSPDTKIFFSRVKETEPSPLSHIRHDKSNMLPIKFWGLHPLFWCDVRLLAEHFNAGLEGSPEIRDSHLLYRTHPIQKRVAHVKLFILLLFDSP